MQASLTFVIIAASVWLAACSRTGSEQPTASAVDVIYSANGWSQAERDQYYHLAEGSELIPYALLANLQSTKTGAPFLHNMERFGFLPDHAGPGNPFGLPVGLTVSLSRDAAKAGVEIVGFNCAACHVAELTYHGRHVRVDGAPAMVDLQGYQVELKESLDAALKDPAKLLALIVAMEKARNTPDTPASGNTSAYAGEPDLQGAGNTQAAPNADPSFHSVSSAAADAAKPAAPGTLPPVSPGTPLPPGHPQMGGTTPGGAPGGDSTTTTIPIPIPVTPGAPQARPLPAGHPPLNSAQ